MDTFHIMLNKIRQSHIAYTIGIHLYKSSETGKRIHVLQIKKSDEVFRECEGCLIIWKSLKEDFCYVQMILFTGLDTGYKRFYFVKIYEKLYI